jgi:hypothetical protein
MMDGLEVEQWALITESYLIRKALLLYIRSTMTIMMILMMNDQVTMGIKRARENESEAKRERKREIERKGERKEKKDNLVEFETN